MNMENQSDQKRIANLMLPFLTEVDGHKVLTCRQAFALAEANDLSLSDIGTVCNHEKVRISGCQLGCF
jgi:hypothetical protein